jgi:hypothetical protein
MIKPFPMATLCPEGWNWESLDEMASGLTEAMDLGRRAFEAEVSACKLREAVDARSRTHEDRIIFADVNASDQLAIQGCVDSSQANMASAVEPVRRLLAEAEKYIVRDPQTKDITNVGDILANVLMRVDTKRLEAEKGQKFPVNLPVKPLPAVVLPSVTGVWMPARGGRAPQVMQAVAPVRMTWRGSLGTARSGIAKPGITPPTNSTVAVSAALPDPPRRKKTHRGRHRGRSHKTRQQETP